MTTPKHAEVYQRESDRTCLLKVPGGWLEFGTGDILGDDEVLDPIRRLLDEDGRLAPERLLGVHGLVVE